MDSQPGRGSRLKLAQLCRRTSVVALIIGAYRGSMSTTNATDTLNAIRKLTPQQLEARLADLDAERATLSRLLRSVRAGERARQKSRQRNPKREGQP